MKVLAIFLVVCVVFGALLFMVLPSAEEEMLVLDEEIEDTLNEGVAPLGHTVTMDDFYFEPATITIRQGETVTWVNEGRGIHYVLTVRGPRILDSKNVKSGESFRYTFADEAPGEYDYFSPVYPNMFGTVIVE